MKRSRRLLAFLACACLACGGTGAVTAYAKTYFEKPETVQYDNVAYGKKTEFRSTEDFSEVLQMYSYFPNGAGINGTFGVQDFVANVLTDGGKESWAMGNLNSTNANETGWLFVDLGEEYVVDRVNLWLLSWWQFNDVIIQTSTTETFDAGTITTLYSNDIDNSLGQGEPIGYHQYDSNGVIGSQQYGDNGHKVSANEFSFAPRYIRYLRIHTRCIQVEDQNSVLAEVEVFSPVKGVMSPQVSKEAGYYESMKEPVSITTPYRDATIYYTLDGSYPTPESSVYTKPLDFSAYASGTVIDLRAVAVLADGRVSLPINAQYVLSAPQNLVRGKDFEFRSIENFSQKIDSYYYTPFLGGLEGSGCYESTENKLTDGVFEWAGNSTYIDTYGWVFFDLGANYNIGGVNFGLVGAWAARNTVIQLSSTADFSSDVTTVFAHSEEGNTPFLNKKGEVIYDGANVNTDLIKNTDGSVPLSTNSAYIYGGGMMKNVSFAPINARYVRLINKIDADVNGGASNSTVFTEIEVINADYVEVNPETNLEHLIKEPVADEKTVRYYVEKDEILSSLPSEMSVLNEEGKPIVVSVENWACETYDKTVSGQYLFTADILNPEKLLNPYAVKATYKVTVMEKANFDKLNALVEESNQLNEVGEKTYTERTFTPFEMARTSANAVNDDMSSVQSEIDEAYKKLNDCKKALEFRADKTRLAALIADCDKIEQNLYTTSTLTGFAENLAEAKDRNNYADCSEKEEAEIYDILLKIYDGLELIGETAELKTLYQSILDRNIVIENYVLSARAMYEDAMDGAEKVIDKKASLPADVSVREVEKAIADLNAATEDIDQYLRGDGEKLAEALAAAQEVIENEYTADSFTAFAEAMTEAQNALGGVFDLTVSETEALIEKLTTTKEGLVALPDKTELRRLVDVIASKDERIYTVGSYTIAKQLLIEANIVLDSRTVTEETITALEKKLDDAIKGLAMKGDVKKLEELVERCENVNTEGYTPASGTHFDEVFASAKSVLLSNDVTQAEVDAIYAELSEANSMLSLKPDKTQLKALIDEHSSDSYLKANLEAAKAVYEDENATVQDVNRAIARLNKAISNSSNNYVLPVILLVMGVFTAVGGFVLFKLISKKAKEGKAE